MAPEYFVILNWSIVISCARGGTFSRDRDPLFSPSQILFLPQSLKAVPRYLIFLSFQFGSDALSIQTPTVPMPILIYRKITRSYFLAEDC